MPIAPHATPTVLDVLDSFMYGACSLIGSIVAVGD